MPLIDPPQGWEYAVPRNCSACIRMGFLGKGSASFRPSLNLATEEVEVNLKQYVRAAKAMQLEEPGTIWRDLGAFTARAGEGRLIEITRESPIGTVKMLQFLLIKGNTAYIATGAASKKDFPDHRSLFTQAFRSLQVADHLFSLLSEEEKQPLAQWFARLEAPLDSEGEKKALWENLQKIVLGKKGLGTYWQFLVLKEGREKLYPEDL